MSKTTPTTNTHPSIHPSIHRYCPLFQRRSLRGLIPLSATFSVSRCICGPCGPRLHCSKGNYHCVSLFVYLLSIYQSIGNSHPPLACWLCGSGCPPAQRRARLLSSWLDMDALDDTQASSTPFPLQCFITHSNARLVHPILVSVQA